MVSETADASGDEQAGGVPHGSGTAGTVIRRPKRVAELIRQELSKILLADLHDPRIGFLTITRVKVPADLRTAQVYVSVLGSPAQQRSTLRGLRSARGRIQGELGNRIELRRVPEISFHADDRVKQALRVSSLLAELAQERNAAEDAPETPGTAGRPPEEAPGYGC